MNFRRTLLVTALSCWLLTGLEVGAARADACDELAKHLASHIKGLKVGRTLANVIYLEHPVAKQAWLGCSSQNVTNEIAASSATVKPSKEFLTFLADAVAVVFTITRDDALRGVQRCASRIGLIRGNNIVTRYRKLDIHCSRTKDTTKISVFREKES